MGLIKWDVGTDRSMPLYVTRKTADGETASYSMPLKQSIRVMLLVYANLLLWGTIGLVFGLVVIVSAIIDVVQALIGLV